MALACRLLLLLALAAVTTEGYRVLILAPTGGKSQRNVLHGLASALAERGHQVVFFSAFKPSSSVKGIREVVPDALAEAATDDKYPNMFKMNEQGIQAGFKQIQTFMSDGPRAALASKELDEILKEKYDLVVFGFYSYSLYFVPLVLKTPFILLTSVPYLPTYTSPLGNPTLPSLHPNIFTITSPGEMTFLQRTKNVLEHVSMEVFRQVYGWYCDRLVAEKFGKGVMPPALEIERNASLIMINSNPAINYPKPLLPNAVEIAGMHCTKGRPLPKELRSFLGDSEFVLFSMGSVARPKDMSASQKSEILAALERLPYKVLLKWDTTDRAGIPSNVLPSKWLPQQDLLASGKCRLFISHGGYASLVESVCHGVPMVMLPVSVDQHANAAQAARLGVAKVLRWDGLTWEDLEAAVEAALSEEHLSAARYRQQLLRSQPVPPRDLAVHWVEHVIRHGGAPHLRSVGAELNFFQYYSLDVLAFLLAVLLLTLKLLVAMVKCCCRCVCGRKAKPSSAEPESKRVKRD
ncbi:UDP-glucosyltransferase 2-like isoform X2 [Amphibalanus amphitrite]|uniref:UDP-glucosyltransferase 2-like isoform X2 n=1 Tax=Amphibalanus amphitrite TaxID=1232801 RepID=UPI001C913A32|nr:UDP-glucosyltransferase 2-like isoform X2 [Amphibalanus amphitrite]